MQKKKMNVQEGSIHISLATPMQSEPAMACDAKAGY